MYDEALAVMEVLFLPNAIICACSHYCSYSLKVFLPVPTFF